MPEVKCSWPNCNEAYSVNSKGKYWGRMEIPISFNRGKVTKMVRIVFPDRWPLCTEHKREILLINQAETEKEKVDVKNTNIDRKPAKGQIDRRFARRGTKDIR